MKFAVLSDVHAEHHFDWSQKLFQRLGEKTDLAFVAHLGDWTSDPYLYSWDKYVRPLLDEIKVPLIGCRGNHDQNVHQWRAWFGHRSRKHIQDNVACYFIDAPSWREEKCDHIDLGDDAAIRFFFSHYPLRVRPQNTHDFDSPCLLKFLKDNGFRAAFSGHVHAFHHVNHEGIDHFITGGGGGEDYNVKFEALVCCHYLVVETNGDQYSVHLHRQHADYEVVYEMKSMS